ncbi:hypothetical protein LDC_0220 [sediment metagenome]|uniref:Transcription regulator TrmB N-terminal domain-containing protein n=1 Tax=sediment metagenome TaxID=749907 RepID=D9PFE1_9ZZZZ
MATFDKNKISPQILEDLGLTRTQSRVYFELLKFGASYPATLAQNSKLTRTTCYRVLESLNQKGLILKIKKNKKFFYEATNPKNIKIVLKNKEEKIKNQLENLTNILPCLTDLFFSSESLHNIEYYEGIDKYEHILGDALKFPGEKIYTFINIKFLLVVLKGKERMMSKYINQRIGAEIKNYSIIPKNQAEFARKWSSQEYNNQQSRTFMGHYRYIDDEKIDYSIYMRIYHDRVALFDFESPKQTGIIIINQRLADMLKEIFKVVWKMSKPI